MKKSLAILLSALLLLAAGCAATNVSDGDASSEQTCALDLTRPIEPPADFEGKHVLVAFFSRAGENFEVGFIDKGNTHIIAEQIAELTHADALFEIRTIKTYPADYQEMTKVAKIEQAQQARPPLADQIENIAQYDIIYLGYPIWYQDLPMPLYTFLESYDFEDKTIIPFCTGSGNAMSGMEADIPRYARGAHLHSGFGIQGKFVHDNPDKAKLAVADWLASLGYTN